MAEVHSDSRVTALDCEILRGAFRKSVAENRIAEREWRMHAKLLARELTGLDDIDPDILDWIVRK
ncbi:hypothetical protein FJV83_27570 [Mesorhizobium sp. WSM4307]|uniref:hypothetical protein n=1 Tax=unclassified Mesorhizobium TaxID=325217 RepID=UPI00115D19C8|nr:MULTISPECIES: hypothetical protein [unclassified Mesorhizobium]TRC72530.1 hypothetical protein FJV80_31980 [Mesorhizobium sp. WSM4310]TRC77385.1 hypothetical protein FJV81_12635 [Mesorhizobium sp. WSM4315]TRC80026.1 hypothetical protein FJV83_27570 [Mesorhizobium sp. WSM4307]